MQFLNTKELNEAAGGPGFVFGTSKNCYTHKIYVAQQNVALPNAICKEKGISLIPIVTDVSHPDVYFKLPKLTDYELPRHLCHIYLDGLCPRHTDEGRLLSPANSQEFEPKSCSCSGNDLHKGVLDLSRYKTLSNTTFVPVKITRTLDTDKQVHSYSYSLAPRIKSDQVLQLARTVLDKPESFFPQSALYTPPLSLENSSITTVGNTALRTAASSSSTISSISSSASNYAGRSFETVNRPILPVKRQSSKKSAGIGKKQRQQLLSDNVASSLKIITNLTNASSSVLNGSVFFKQMPKLQIPRAQSTRHICKDTASALAGLEMLFSGQQSAKKSLKTSNEAACVHIPPPPFAIAPSSSLSTSPHHQPSSATKPSFTI